MKFGIGQKSDTNVIVGSALPDPRESRERAITPPSEFAITTSSDSASRGPQPARGNDSGAFPEQILVAAMEQFGQMQQQLLSQTHQQSMMLAQVIAGMQQEQNSAIYEQISRIQAVTNELVALQRPRLELNSEFHPNPSNLNDADEVIDAVHEIHPGLDIRQGLSQNSKDESGDSSAGEALGGQESRKNPATVRNTERTPDNADAYQRVTRRIHELERERTNGWRKVMSMLGVKEIGN
jgi:hypothetical protein